MKQTFCFLILLAVFTCASHPVQALQAEVEKSQIDQIEEKANPLGDVEKKKRMERNLDIGTVLLGGIIILGILLIAIVMILGKQFRRIAREPLPNVKQNDPLWYLKEKPKAEESVDSENKTESNEDEES